MSYRYQISGGIQKMACPFICQNTPFIGINGAFIRPLVCKKLPSVSYGHFMRAFTLIEVIVVLTVLGILVGIAAPSLSQFVHSNQLVAATNDLIADFNLARSESIKRSTAVGVCKTSDGSTCTNTGTWASGWLVFVDTDGGGGWSAGDQILRIHESLATSISIPAAAADSVVYGRIGGITSGSGTYSLCIGKIHQQRDINLSTTGRLNVTPATC
jgi:type IV fimbrial biogenesis protein FimT